ncbi:hypothetical protein HJFPF1_07560 [Paramyrothecium foliicola]|nr:hypothetical protein HJFPF1_07560 [Paramyrothecium foliicola]
MIAENFVVTDRGGVVENKHEVHAAIVDSTGKLLFYVGNPSRVTLIRSAAKPVQALAVVETGAFDKYGFDDADLALMCASHNSEPQHIDQARAMLQKVDAREDDLRCGGHPSIDSDLAHEWIRKNITPTRVYNNCSGKHAGIIGGSKALNASIKDYHLANHPIQQRVKQVVEEVAGLEPDEVLWGIDGCNMPAPAYSLFHLAKTYALFAQAADDIQPSGAKNTTNARKKWMARIFHAMTQYPHNVAGNGRFCTILMDAYKGQLFGKVGADACYSIGIRESEDTKRLGASGAIGIAVKISDGNLDILYAALPEILEQLQIGTAETRQALDRFHHVKLQNTMGVVTGQVECLFRIQSA